MMNFLFNLLDVSPKNEEGNFGMDLERNVLELRGYKVVTCSWILIRWERVCSERSSKSR